MHEQTPKKPEEHRAEYLPHLCKRRTSTLRNYGRNDNGKNLHL